MQRRELVYEIAKAGILAFGWDFVTSTGKKAIHLKGDKWLRVRPGERGVVEFTYGQNTFAQVQWPRLGLSYGHPIKELELIQGERDEHERDFGGTPRA